MEPEYRCWSRGIRQGNLQRPFGVFERPLSSGSGFEWLVCPFALNDLEVEIGGFDVQIACFSEFNSSLRSAADLRSIPSTSANRIR